jgi:hypothetical protein
MRCISCALVWRGLEEGEEDDRNLFTTYTGPEYLYLYFSAIDFIVVTSILHTCCSQLHAQCDHISAAVEVNMTEKEEKSVNCYS